MNEALQRTSEKARAMCDKLTLKNAKLEKRNVRLTKKAKRLYKVVKSLGCKLATRKPKRNCKLEVLAKAVEVTEGAHNRSEEI